MSTKAKSVVIVAVVVAVVAGVAAFLMLRSDKQAVSVSTESSPAASPPKRERPPLRQGSSPVEARGRGGPLPVPKNDAERRQNFARLMEWRFARKGQQIQVRAEGEDSTIFQMTWPVQSPDKNHMEQLKTAEAFQRELQSKGFRSLVLMIGPRVVWSVNME